METPPNRPPREVDFEVEDLGEVDFLEAEPDEAGEHAGTPERQADEEAGDDQRPERKRRRRRRGGRRSKRDRRPGEAEATSGSATDVEGVDSEGSLGQELEEPSASEPPTKERSKRRRRRGSGRGRDRQRAAEDETRRPDSDDDAEGQAADDTLLDDAAAGDDADLGSDGGDDDADSPIDKNSHRAIPAWEEAIGFIIATNMESRAKNPKSGQQRGRGRGRGRGNSRGGGHRRGS